MSSRRDSRRFKPKSTPQSRPVSNPIQSLPGFGSMKPTISYRTASILFRQISASIDAGLSLVSTLEHLTQHAMNDASAKLGREMLETINQGGTLSDAFKRWGGKLPAVVPALITVGERTGHMVEAFASAAEICEFLLTVRNRIFSSLIYPLFLLIFALLVLPLPLIFAEGLASYFAALKTPFTILFVIAVAICILIKVKAGSETVNRVLSQILLSLPIIGKVMRKLAITRFAKVLSTGLSSGLDIIESVKLAAGACGNPFIRQKVYAIIPNLLGGFNSLAVELMKTHEFPNLFCTMLTAGEKSGKLEESLNRIAQMYHEEAITTIDRTMKMMGPLAFIVIALYLGYQVVRFWAGYFGQLGGIIGF